MSVRIMRNNGDYPDWICQRCAEKLTNHKQQNHTSTWHFDTCGWCKSYTPVTQPRDYRYPHYEAPDVND